VPDFTAAQIEATEFRKRDACVVAGPGSGKTTVLVERYRVLIEEHGFRPSQILAITFTEKAAANMKAKVAEQFRHDPIQLRELETAWVSTIHGFCARVLRENAIAAGIDPGFSVLDAHESDALQTECLRTAVDEFAENRRQDALDLILALHVPALVSDLMNAYDGIRSAGLAAADVRRMANPGIALTPEQIAERVRKNIDVWPSNLTATRRTQRREILEWCSRASDISRYIDVLAWINDCSINLRFCSPEVKEELKQIRQEQLPLVACWAADRHNARFREIIFDVLERFELLYGQRKTETGSLDFNDLERHTIRLLKDQAEIRNRLQARFNQIMLDEFQDINEQQWKLLELVRAPEAFFAVGDVNQSIYGFRHARPEIFIAYRETVKAGGKHHAELLHNFRSRPEILACVRHAVGCATGIEDRELQASGAFRDKGVPSIEILKICDPDKEEACEREARWIAHRILSLRNSLPLGPLEGPRLATFSDFAVLVRNSDSMASILRAFDRAGIPYVSSRRPSFLVSREGRDLATLIRVIDNPQDEISLAALLRSPLAGLSDEAILRIRFSANSLSAGFNRLQHDNGTQADWAPDDGRAFARFAQNFKRWRQQRSSIEIDRLLVRAMDDCGYQWTPETGTGDNVEKFLQLARARGTGRTLSQFLRELESLTDAADTESDLSDEDQGNRVQVLTAHAAKGLEFPVTIIAAMDKGTQQGTPPVTFTPECGLGIKWSDPTHKRDTGVKDSWAHRNSDLRKQRDEQESNRLLYVAMTRAEEHLILSYSTAEKEPRSWASKLESRFGLKEQTNCDESRLFEGFAARICATSSEPPSASAYSAEHVDSDRILVIPRPKVADQHDSIVNVTSLTAFANCPRKYYLQRFIGYNSQQSPGFDAANLQRDVTEASAADLGSQVHQILAGDSGTFSAEAHSLARVFEESPLGRRAAQAVKCAREWEFIFEVEDMLVRGKVDLWFEENEDTIIVDYKTDAVTASDAHRHSESYASQLALYALAVERATGRRPAKAYLHYLRPNILVEVPVDDRAIRNAGELIQSLSEAQETLQFDLREGEQCRHCQFYRGLCPAGLARAVGCQVVPGPRTRL
jgi:ATP-dependent helicase/nuclease subunit A